jgi:hypothetical protein
MQSIMVQAGLDGAFAVERLPAGVYKVTSRIGSGVAQTLASAQVTVEPGKTARVELAIATGNITLEVEIRGEADAAIDAAQVFVFEGAARAANAKQLLALFSDGAGGGSRVAFAFPPKPAAIEGLNPGAHSVCVIPINGDMNDPTFMERLQRHSDQLAVHCRPATVAPTPATQRFTAVVPPMAPLP